MTTDVQPAPPATHPRTDPRTLAALATLCLGGLVVSLTQTLVIPIQGQLPVLLHASPSSTAWVVTSTLLAAAVTMPVSGRLADLRGKVPVLVASMGLLALGSLVCALSSSLVPVLAGRVLQGMAMGFIPVGIALLREIAPAHLAATSVAAMSATLGVGGALGLPLAAWVAQDHDWHALFWVGTALGLLVLAAVVLLVPHVHDAHAGRLDVPGALGLAVGLVAVLVGFTRATTWGWTDARTLGSVVGGIAVLLAWGRFELGRPDPLVDLRTAARRPVLLTNLAALAIGFGMMAQSVVMPQLLQLPTSLGYGLGQTILQAGLWMAPGGLVMMAFAPVSSRLLRTVGARRTLMVGGAVLGLGYLVALALMDAPWQLLLASCVTCAGVGIGYAAMPTLVLDAVPLEEAAAAVGLNSLMRSVGTTLAAAVMATVLTTDTRLVGTVAVPAHDAFRWCFVIGALAAFVGVALASAVPARRAASS